MPAAVLHVRKPVSAETTLFPRPGRGHRSPGAGLHRGAGGARGPASRAVVPCEQEDQPGPRRLELGGWFGVFPDKCRVVGLSLLSSTVCTDKNCSNAIYLQIKQKRACGDGPGNLTPVSVGKRLLHRRQ